MSTYIECVKITGGTDGQRLIATDTDGVERWMEVVRTTSTDECRAAKRIAVELRGLAITAALRRYPELGEA